MRHPLILATLIFIIAFTTMAQQEGILKSPQAEDRRGGEQITEITLERTACFGTCPMYKVTLRRDGTATYAGRRFVERQGTYTGKVYGFDRLAQLMDSRGFFNLKDNYSMRATDLPSAITSAVQAGKRKTIVNYGDAGPVELWGIEKAIDGMMASVKWEKVSDK